MKKFFLILYLAPLFSLAQNLPKIGNDTLIDVASWNIEWFGDTGYGPTDETTQFNNVKAVLEKTDIDVWGLAEMSNTSSFTSLTNALPNYSSVNSSFSQTQKMCLFYKKSMFNFINAEQILSSSNYDFASRPPLMVTLATKGDSTLQVDTLYFIVMHLKANTGTTSEKLESYNRRKRAVDALKVFIESTLNNKKYFILGDWNDRLDYSIYNNSAVTPFKQLLDANYNFITKPLSDAGKRSYATGGFIDHILPSPRMDSFYVKQSASVYDNIGSIIANYSNSTSDHYPIYGRFLFNKKPYIKPIDSIPNDTLPTDTVPPVDTTHTSVINKYSVPASVSVYPNPFTYNLHIQVPAEHLQATFQLFNHLGQLVSEGIVNKTLFTIDTNTLTNGMYYIKINNTYTKIYKE
ncbi:MAG: T9SS type A sorting domain-containing protein [Bacteroidota bacterium]